MTLKALVEAVPPWMVAFVRFGPGRRINLVECAGTLVAPSWVLTAAHAVIDPKTITAVIGTQQLSSGDSPNMHSVRRVLPHPMYKPLDTPPPYDLALVELTEAVQLNEGQDVLELAGERDFSPRGEVFGWGEGDASSFFFSDRMKQIAVTVQPPTGPLTFNATSASHLTTCYGDSGGPLLIHRDDHWVQIGITSSLTVARRCRSAAIYTAVAPHRGWIDDNIRK